MTTHYTSPPVTVDGVIFQLLGGVLHVLLVKRPHPPYEGMWALPGAYVSREQTTRQALDQALVAKAGLPQADLAFAEQLYTFDAPAVQQDGGHAVAVVYYGLCRSWAPPANEQLHSPAFFAVNELPELAYQHDESIDYAVQRLRAKVLYTNIIFALLPLKFTLSQLQIAYEAVLGTKLDKRNFRRKFLQLGLIQALGEQVQEGAHRPAQLYRFNQQKLHTLSRSFD